MSKCLPVSREFSALFEADNMATERAELFWKTFAGISPVMMYLRSGCGRGRCYVEALRRKW
jgi:hypothetical protein